MRYAFVDLETTGGLAVRDRVIEVAVVVREDASEVARWQSLVNPECEIPPFIARYTGINDAMVADAPRFGDIADALEQVLEGAIFVAHNARFDYGFLKNEFIRLGRRWQSAVMCTVKLSRLLYPQYNKHNLDAIIERHRLPRVTRHRAMGDVEAMLGFVDHARGELGEVRVQQAIDEASRRPSLPPYLPSDLIEQLPQSPGVYRFYGKDDELLYVGKSVNLFQRVQSHFSGDYRSGKGQRMASQVHRVDWTQTAGELGALLLELQEIKAGLPVFNRRSRASKDLFTFVLSPDAQGYMKCQLQPHVEIATLDNHFGLFKSKRQAHKVMAELAKAHGLCDRLCGLESAQGRSTGECFQHQLGRCRGACCGEETAERYNLRIQIALNGLKLRSWPWEEIMVVHEHDRFTGLNALHLIHNWCHLGTLTEPDPAQLEALPEIREFELESYKLLSSYLLDPKKKITLLPLSKLFAAR